MWDMPISLHASNMSFSRAAPSSSEYWVWTCRCVNGGFVTASASKKNWRRQSPYGLRTVWGTATKSMPEH
ncbi:hypothetical protein GCM10017557_61330 [Streptomyces aurantiacus]|uniref:Uncharacterized protein n=1 Tax=Streptomyces aurantiacus TaxID=47760 RepID=A0A7G1PBB2_9ACTN|nr:hypothetical protein GCM10017557_61330 [Streptomyces aurantiacus]